VPEPGESDVLLKIGAAGFCHTDYQVWEGVYGSELPLVPSHEPVGTIVKLGSKVQGGKWKIGDRVGCLLFQHKCGHCTNCGLLDDIRFCENNNKTGLTDPGAMEEYMTTDAASLVPLPDSVSFEQGAPLMCAGASPPLSQVSMSLS
jgi:D-arabinose 1-dehydrogenase-like Zn-dependent alcohol dehydrogenase